MYERQTETKKRPKRKRQEINQTSIPEEYPYYYDEQSIQPIPQTIQYSVPNGLSQIKEHKSISSVFRHIQDSVDYNMLDEGEILAEKKMLEDQVKFLNDEMNQLVKKKINKIQQGLSRKLQKGNKNNSRFKYNEWDDAGIQMQVMNNRKKLALLRDEYEFLSAKLTKIQKSDLKIKYDNMIKEIKENITKTKLMLFDKKRKNVLNGKKISEIDKRDAHKIYFDYQQEYVALAKKKEDYTKRVDKISQDNANLVQQNSKLQQKQISLRREAIQILSSLPNQAQEQHQKVMYETKVRKMELALRKRERDQQEYKRKYYGFLKQYEKAIENSKQVEQKLKNIVREVENSYNTFKGKQRKAQEIERMEKNNSAEDVMRVWRIQSEKKEEQSGQEKEGQENDDGFMLTQINNQKSTTRITKKNQRMKTDEIIKIAEPKSRSHSDYQYKTPKLLPRLKTEYSREEKEARLNSGYKQKMANKSQRKDESRIKETSNYNNSEIQEDEYNAYTDDFEAESPQLK